MKVCRHFMTDEAEMEKVCTSVFISPEWLMLDMGLITEAEALKRMQKRLPDDHAKEMARLCLEHWNEYCMWKVPGMEELVRELKAEGFGIYLCSNASLRMVTWYKNIIPAWECFDGILYSAEVKCCLLYTSFSGFALIYSSAKADSTKNLHSRDSYDIIFAKTIGSVGFWLRCVSL